MDTVTNLFLNMKDEGTWKENCDASTQLHGCSIVPRIGEEIYFCSERDENGNYNDKGNIMQRFEGIVEKISYSFEEHGHDSQHNRWTTFISIYMRSKGL